MASTYLPLLVDSVVTPEIPTFKDVVDFVRLYGDAKSDRSKELAIRSVQSAYRELVGRHPWKWFNRKCIIPTSADTSVTAASYSATTNAFTVDSGDAPSWARDGSVQISSGTYEGEYEISHVVSGATDVVYLKSGHAIGTDIASQDIAFVRRRYPLPIDFNAEKVVYDETDEYQLKRLVAHEEHVQGAWSRFTPDESVGYVIRGGRSAIYRSIELSPPPTDARIISVSYRSRGRPLRLYEREVTVTASDSSTSVTFATAPPAYCLGCVLRAKTDGEQYPTSLSGLYPWTTQRLLIALSSTTGTIDYATDEALSSDPGILSDPLDVDPEILMPVIELMALRKYAQYTRSDDAAKISNRDVENALEKARQQDSDALYSDSVFGFEQFADIEDYSSYASS